MYKKSALLCTFFFVILLSVNGLTASSPAIRITGSVKQPLNVSMEDLSRFESVTARLNEVSTDNNFHGAFPIAGTAQSAARSCFHTEGEIRLFQVC